MSANTKCFVRPKVRFCQTDVDKSKELKNSVDGSNSNRLNKPKIRNIVTLDKPVIVLKSNQAFNDLDTKETKSVNCTQKTEFLGCDDEIPFCAHTSGKTENQRPLNDADNSVNTKVCFEENDKLKKTNTSLATLQEKESNKILKSQNSVKTDIKKMDYTTDKKGKENNALFTKKGTNNTVKNSSHIKVAQCKIKPCPSNGNKKVNSAKPSRVSLTSDKVKPVVNVMPCYKYNTTASKIKAFPVKKTMVRDIVGPKIKPYVGPGVPRKNQDILRIAKIKDIAHIKPCTSGEKLARPEYNSVMCTINKLNETKKQKVVVDLEHLPPIYKNLINGKISSALDFPLDEAIYKNLVNLSVDEKQLPSRLTRSKDPEPRQRDVVPILSDFFLPEPTEEYCTPVSIKPIGPEAVDSWSAFRINDKIFEWKHSLDHL
ncbi:uncharacterized protein LOC117222898 [Megalopta genalis]|uniref:uncharacterized protein LOC117222898 n=1 Tax=Megalopta genalis TaxID=115081 RepID=UPI003FD08E44